jgi:hypothetical protein
VLRVTNGLVGEFVAFEEPIGEAAGGVEITTAFEDKPFEHDEV